MSTVFVGVGHRARQGKGILAKKIRALAPYDIEIYGFANCLKAYCRASGWMTVKDGPLLQLVGTDLIRRVNPGLWIRCLDYQIEEEAPTVAVLMDLRFPDEMRYIKDRGGLTVDLMRLNPDGTQYIATDRPADHPSETALDGARFDLSYRVPAENWNAHLDEIARDIWWHVQGLRRVKAA